MTSQSKYDQVEVAGRIRINRTPVLNTVGGGGGRAVWSFDQPTVLTLGQAVAGMSAHAKGVSLGIIKPKPELVRQRGDQLANGATLHCPPTGRSAGGAYPRRLPSFVQGEAG